MLNKDWLNLLFLCSGLIVVRLPFVGVFFRAFCTLIHESCHAILGLILNQQIQKIQLEQDLSGSAIITGGNKFTNSLIALAGYFGASAVALGFTFLLTRGNYYAIIFILLPLCVVNLVFWIRNLFGIIWVLFQIFTMGLLLYFKQELAMISYLGILSACLLSESLYSAFVILKISFSQPNKSGDSALLAKFTKIPAPFWGIIFLGQALVIYALAIALLLKPWVDFTTFF
jgi:hypothetical protein